MTISFRLPDGRIVEIPGPLAGCGCPERAAGGECVVCKVFREMLEEDEEDQEEDA